MASPQSENNDSFSESTRAYNLKMEQEFKKAFPLRQDKTTNAPLSYSARIIPGYGRTPSAYGSSSTVKGATPNIKPHLAPIKCSFDESFVSGATAQNLNSKVVELNADIDLAKRKIERLQNELNAAEEREKKRNASYEEIVRTNAELMKKVGRLEDDIKGINIDQPSSWLMATLDSYRVVSDKQFTWLQWKDAQLNVCANILRKAGLWNRETQIEMKKSYYSLEPQHRSDEDVIEFSRGSVQDFIGLDSLNDFVEEEEGDGNTPSQEINPNETTIRGDMDESIMMDTSMTTDVNQMVNQSILGSTLPMAETTSTTSAPPPPPVFECDLDASVLDSSLYERDERIQELECKLDKLQDQLSVYKSRCNKYAVLQEENASLRQELNLLRQLNQDSAREYFAATRVNEELITNMTSPDVADRKDRIAARQLNETITKAQKRINDLEEDLEQGMVQLDAARQEANEAIIEKETWARQYNDIYDLFTQKNNEIEEVRCQLNEAREEIARLKGSATDAGDTTQIVHMAMNPLEMARVEMKEKEELERKRSLSNDAIEQEPIVKKWRNDEDDEAINKLKSKLEEAEARTEKISRKNNELAKQYRSIVNKITGFEIKMKQEDCVQVVSLYDPQRQEFGFLVRDNVVEMIELPDKPFSGPDRFVNEATEMLGEQGSVPGFLSTVQLRLLRERMIDDEETLMVTRRDDDKGDETMNRRDGDGDGQEESIHTFSILHED